MWRLLVTLHQDQIPALEESLGDSVLSVSDFELDEARKIRTFEALFEEKPSDESITMWLKDQAISHWTFEPLPQKDWLEDNRKSFPPLEVGKFFIHGSHIHDHFPKDKYCLQVDASTAFGSGSHESTQGCLQAIQDISALKDFEKPMDMGCGSGILALAMAALLKRPIWAVDNDPVAVEKTLYNARINNLEEKIHTFVSDGWKNIDETGFDLITANILAGPLCDMASDMASHISPHGIIILSGLLISQEAQVVESYKNQGFSLKKSYPLHEWTTLAMTF